MFSHFELLLIYKSSFICLVIFLLLFYMSSIAQKRRFISLLYEDDEEAYKHLRPNPEVEDVVYELDLLSDERILLPVLSVFISMQKMDNFLRDIGYEDNRLYDESGEDKCLNDIVSMLNFRKEIDAIKWHISVSNNTKSVFNNIMKEIKEERSGNDIEDNINKLLDIILEIFDKFGDKSESNNVIGLFELFKKLKDKFPDRGLKTIEYEKSKESDSFVNIFNSLEWSNDKYLEFNISNKVFQFPQNRIYVRDCYITYYSKIWNYINSLPYNRNIIILGQPGIGKTSFIYYLLFMLKNDLSTRYFLECDYNNKEAMVKQLNKLLIIKNKIEKCKKEIENNIIKSDIISTKIDILEKKIEDKKDVPIIDNYRKSISYCETLINDQINIIKNIPLQNVIVIGQIPFDDFKPKMSFYNEMNKIYASVSDREELKPLKSTLQQFINAILCVDSYMDKEVKGKQTQCNRIETEYNKKLKEKEGMKKECNDKINKYINELEEIKKKQIQYNEDLKEIKKVKIECDDKIDTCKNEIKENLIILNNNVNAYNDYNEWKEELEVLKMQNDQLNSELSKLNYELDIFNNDFTKLNNEFTILNNQIKEKSKSKIEEEEIMKSNYSSSVDLVNKIVAYKDIFVVKSVKGNNTVRIYRLTNGVLNLLETTEDIKNSIVITDTFGNIHASNIVISISSPDDKNFKKYEEMKYHKTLYLDSFNDKEMKEWYKYCIAPELPTDFENVCEMYGNVTRQVYFHYLYENNYHKNYWEYYKQLINSVVGTIGFDNFVTNYIPENNLKKNPLSNIIMKYDLKYNDEGELEPKDSLIFVSPKIGMYVCSMLFPPKKIDDYIKISKYYRLRNDSRIPDDSSIHDKSIDRMLLKQIAGYKIALGEMKIKRISNYNIEVKRNSSSFSYFPFNAIEEVTYILDEDDIFDFVVNDVFVKILHKDKVGDDYGDDNYDMKVLNGLDGKRLKELKEKYFDTEKKIGYLTINEGEIIDSTNDNTEREIKEIPDNPAPSNKFSEIEKYEGYGDIKKRMNNSPNEFLNVLNIIKDDLPDKYQIVLDNLEEFALLLKRENDYYYYDRIYKDKDYYTYEIDSHAYKYRKCYEEMIYIIERNIINDERQKNYLIFGSEGIGKTTLSDFLNDYFIKQLGEYFNILLIKIKYNQSSYYYYFDKDKKVSKNGDKITPTTPYIVISDEVVVGEDEYSDAKMIILIGNSSDEKIKTYQSKRCPLIMYIPPFTEEEIIFLTNNDDNEIQKIKKYGSIPGYYNKNEESLRGNIKSVVSDENKIKIVKEMLNGEPTSPLTKGYSSKICIYNTFENDVTKSTRLIFLSDEVKKIANQNCIDLDVMKNSKNMFNTYEEQPNGELGGIIFERLILYLCKWSKKFQDLLLLYYGLSEGFTIKYVEIKSKEHLEIEIGKTKDYLKQNIIPLFDLSYNSCFPDVDFILCFIGVQITVGLTHSLSIEIIEMLNVWKTAIKAEIETEYRNEDISLPEYLIDLFNSDLKFLVISNNRNVDMYYREVKDYNKFPSVLSKHINQTRKEHNDRVSVEEINSKKDMMYISLDELKVMVNEAKQIKN